MIREAIAQVSPEGVKKVSPNKNETFSEKIRKFNGLLNEKLDNKVAQKSAKIRQVSVDKSGVKTLVCVPTTVTKAKGGGTKTTPKVRKSVKDIKKEMELRSMTPINSFFKKDRLISDKNQKGESNSS